MAASILASILLAKAAIISCTATRTGSGAAVSGVDDDFDATLVVLGELPPGKCCVAFVAFEKEGEKCTVARGLEWLLLLDPMLGMTMKLSSPESGLGGCCQLRPNRSNLLCQVERA